MVQPLAPRQDSEVPVPSARAVEIHQQHVWEVVEVADDCSPTREHLGGLGVLGNTLPPVRESVPG